VATPEEVEEVIKACGGDARSAVRTLLIANDFLAAELERAQAQLSKGFVRGKLPMTSTDKIAGADDDPASRLALPHPTRGAR
jgi:hypothetical protein